MKLLYSSIQEGTRACLMALSVSGFSYQAVHRSLPFLTLQLDEKDHTGNYLEISGELSICRYVLERSPTQPIDSLDTAEWVFYELKPLLAAGQIDFKTNDAVHRTLKRLETAVSTGFLGGQSASAADLLSFCYGSQLFIGNQWVRKNYTGLIRWAQDLIPLFISAGTVSGELDPTYQVLIIKAQKSSDKGVRPKEQGEDPVAEVR